MINFKEIAEKCLAGELSGTFIIDKGRNWHSSYLQRHYVIGRQMPGQYVLGPGVIYNEIGQCENREKVKIIDFIPDNMQEQIKIDIPEGKVPVMEQTENGVVITWKEKELTYTELLNDFRNNLNCIHVNLINSSSQAFHKKVEVLRKLTNIRNYFGKPTGDIGYTVIQSGPTQAATNYRYLPVFAKKEHAEQAIKMLGDELKYLWEPW
jgi:hypothetical protein